MTVQAEPDLWPRISAVIPAMNESRNPPYLFERLPARLHEVILVNGNSVDATIAVAWVPGPCVRIAGQTRRGKGNALACGSEHREIFPVSRPHPDFNTQADPRGLPQEGTR